MIRATPFLAVGVMASVFGLSAASAERHMMAPRVPPDKLAEARALQNPLPDSPDIVEKGKALYEGKGACFNCHGKSGQGDGPAAVGLNPSPRNFHHHGFWRHRTEGELFWVIKNGSAGTSMIGFGSVLSDDEIWSVIRYLRTFAGSHGPDGGMGRHRGMGRMGPGGEGCCEGEARDR
jgi:mono/diheme cytochrome c family protein